MSKYSEIAPRIWSGSATDEELRALTVADIVAIKSDSAHMRTRLKAKRPKANLEARTADHVASDETADRMGDIIRVKGWDLEPFKQNPLLLWNHDSSGPPIGRVESVKKGSSEEGGKALLSTSRFFDAEKNPFADFIWRMVADGDLPAVSVGFMPRKTVRPDDAEERSKLGLGEWGVVYEEAELLELSVVTVPANPNALMRRLDALVEAGTVEKSLVAQFAERIEPKAKTVVTVPGLSRTDAPGGFVIPGEVLEQVAAHLRAPLVQPDTAHADELAALRAEMVALKNALESGFSALRAAFEQTTRAAVAGAIRSDPPKAPAKAAVESQSADSESYGAALLEVGRSRLRSPKEG